VVTVAAIRETVAKELAAIDLAEPDYVQALVVTIAFQPDVPKRRAAIRKDYLHLEKVSAAAAKALGRAQDPLNSLPPVYRDATFERVLRATHDLETISRVAWAYSEGFRAQGGRPKMQTFELLVRLLAAAFERTTGRKAKVTWNASRGRFEGKFVNLVETVLPIVRRCAEQFGQPLHCPSTARARGKHIVKVTAVKRRSATIP
jgi:hypothetical protein